VTVLGWAGATETGEGSLNRKVRFILPPAPRKTARGDCGYDNFCDLLTTRITDCNLLGRKCLRGLYAWIYDGRLYQRFLWEADRQTREEGIICGRSTSICDRHRYYCKLLGLCRLAWLSRHGDSCRSCQRLLSEFECQAQEEGTFGAGAGGMS
jgi:hypothetical protein